MGVLTIENEWDFDDSAIAPTDATSPCIVRARHQYCPVNLRGISEKANSGAAFWMTKGVSDLNQK